MKTKAEHSQAELSNITPEGVVIPTEEKKASFKDPAFATNKTTPIHRWVPWIAGFSNDFVRGVIKNYISNRTGLVLDPFAGVGTTLLEARLNHQDSIGFEINPYAALSCRIKLNSHQISTKELLNKIDKFHNYYKISLSQGCTTKNVPPEGFKTRSEFYSPKILNKVLITLDFIDSIENEPIRDLFRLAFASTMVAYSNYSYEPSLGRRSHAGRNNIEDCPVEQVISKKLNEMAEDIDWYKRRLSKDVPSSRIVSESFFEYKNHLSCGSVDLIITSPPYLNNYHYNRNTRPHLYWLEFAKSPQDFIKLEHKNFGNYWQTVRDKDKMDLIFKSPDPDLEECLDLLSKQNPEKGIYGGQGWANYATSYFNDCYRFSLAMQEVLKEKGTAIVVIGNSILQGIMIPTDQYLADIAKSVGLDVVGIEIPRSKRIGNSIIQSKVRATKAKKTHQLYEAVVEIRNS
jgi:DNA modification methylase